MKIINEIRKLNKGQKLVYITGAIVLGSLAASLKWISIGYIFYAGLLILGGEELAVLIIGENTKNREVEK